jgi:Exopolysaccharide biosynthesis protein YbjH
MNQLSCLFRLRPVAALVCGAAMAGPLSAQTSQPATQDGPYGLANGGSRGGLTIPGPLSLPTGDMALGLSNYQEPAWGNQPVHNNYLLGFGLGWGLELTGRIADYNNPPAAGLPLLGGMGIRDLSANLKWQLPRFWQTQTWMPEVAVGMTDVGGGAVNFGSHYLVLGDETGALRWRLGFGKAKDPRSKPYALDGGFGGLEWMFGNTGFSALAEHDSHQAHAGLRYHSEPIAALGQARLVGTLQRSFGGKTVAGLASDATSLGLHLVMPLGRDSGGKTIQGDAPALPLHAAGSAPGSLHSAADRAEQLHKALVQAGLERVRVGQTGADWVVQYENLRYAQNEADALGIVLGLAAEWAPDAIQRLRAVSLKGGQAMASVTVPVQAVRAFMRGQSSLGSDLQAADGADASLGQVAWATGVAGQASAHSWVRLELRPLLAYAVATEYGLADYSAALQAEARVPLWRGGEAYTQAVGRVSNSANYGPGGVYNADLIREGAKTVALQQTAWLAPGLLASVGVGRYLYDRDGVQGQVQWQVPGRDDLVRLRGAAYKVDTRYPNDAQMAATYRWVAQPSAWFEAGLQQYSDGTQGPTLGFTRWFGDVSVNLNYRRGGNAQFVGLDISFPLTPRRGMAANPIHLGGASQFQMGLRTRLTDQYTAINLVQPNAARDLAVAYQLDSQQLNAGRQGAAYWRSQQVRMRDSFYLHARALLPS